MNYLPALLALLYIRGGIKRPESEEESTGDPGKLQTPQAYIPPNPVKYPDDYCRNFDDSEVFDYVVIGSGPGGSTVSRRLAEDPNVKVLLLEAGGDPPDDSDIPLNAGKVSMQQRWNFHTVDDEGLCEIQEGEGCPVSPGKVLGGSSILNAMMYVRGNKYDYNSWAELGCKGWSYKEMLPYFKKHENYRVHPLVSDIEAKFRKGNVASKKYHGTNGPLYNSAFPPDPKTFTLRQSLKEAQIQNDIKYNADVNGADQMGVTDLGAMVDPLGYRNSIVKAYLLNIPNNLKICKYSLAMKVSLKKKRVDGIQFQYNGTGESKEFVAKAKREYIISAGPLNTPLLLERSGIGNKDILEKVGVPVLHELRGVGENYQDHLPAIQLFKVDSLSDAAPNPLSDSLNMLTSFVNITDSKSKVPDIQFIMRAVNTKLPSAVAEKSEVAATVNGIIDEGLTALYFACVHLTQPNTGSIHITQTADPNISPEIRTNHLTSDVEIKRVVKAIRFSRELLKSEPMKRHKPELVVIKECRKFETNSEEEILCQAKNLIVSLYHQTGVTSMGPKDNPNSVVDPELRIIGLENVRIVDSGVMPIVPRGNTEIPTVTIAEKAADMIKRSWS